MTTQSNETDKALMHAFAFYTMKLPDAIVQNYRNQLVDILKEHQIQVDEDNLKHTAHVIELLRKFVKKTKCIPKLPKDGLFYRIVSDLINSDRNRMNGVDYKNVNPDECKLEYNTVNDGTIDLFKKNHTVNEIKYASDANKDVFFHGMNISGKLSYVESNKIDNVSELDHAQRIQYGVMFCHIMIELKNIYGEWKLITKETHVSMHELKDTIAIRGMKITRHGSSQNVNFNTPMRVKFYLQVAKNSVLSTDVDSIAANHVLNEVFHDDMHATAAANNMHMDAFKLDSVQKILKYLCGG